MGRASGGGGVWIVGVVGRSRSSVGGRDCSRYLVEWVEIMKDKKGRTEKINGRGSGG